METKKDVVSTAGVQRQGSGLLVFGIILLVALSAGALYLSFQKSAIVRQQIDLDAQIKTLGTQIQDMKSQKLEAAQLARQWINDIEKSEIRWSTVIKSLKSLVPLSAGSQPKIRFLSYAGSPGGKLTLNAETIPASLPPFGDVAELVSVFNGSSFFKDAYVPSITRGLSDNGNTVLSFIFNLTYTESLPGAQVSN